MTAFRAERNQKSVCPARRQLPQHYLTCENFPLLVIVKMKGVASRAKRTMRLQRMHSSLVSTFNLQARP